MSTPVQSTKQTTQDEFNKRDLEAINGSPVVLNIGCGTDDEGIGIDVHYDPDIRHDLDDGIPVADNSVDRVKAEHVLEHVTRPLDLIDEMYRVLVDGGRAELEVPNAGWLPVRLWLTQDIQGFWSHKDPNRDGHWLARRLGNPAPERTRHNSLWTRRLLVEHLERAGFDVDAESSHLSRNISVTATKGGGSGSTLHHLERERGEDLASGDYWAQTRAAVLADWVAEADPDSVLDLGCGSGYLTARVQAAHPSASVRGIDVDEDSITVAQSRNSPARFDRGDLFNLDAGPADVVILADVIEHFQEPERVVRAARDALADDGQLLVSVPAYPSLFGPHDEANDHAERYDRARLTEVGEAAGMGLVDHRHTNVVPLLPYFIYQRIMKRQVPDSARGGHGPLLQRVKGALIRAETTIPWPVGITLLGRFEP